MEHILEEQEQIGDMHYSQVNQTFLKPDALVLRDEGKIAGTAHHFGAIMDLMGLMRMRPNKMPFLGGRLLGMILFILLRSFTIANAQHNSNDLLRSDNWDIIGTLDFRLEKNNDIYPIFSEILKKNANKDFELTGYLIPIREGLRQSRFLLSTLPVNQCFYCGQNGIPAMILVDMVEGIRFTYKPVHLKGKLKLKNVNLRDYPSIILTNAVSLD